MNTPVRKTYFIIPVLYLAIAVFFLHTGLDHGNRFFTITKGPVSISGSGQEGLDRNSLSSLVVKIPGLEMDLFKTPVYIADSSGNRKNIKVTGYSFANDSLIISFTDSAKMIFTFDPENKGPELITAVFTMSGSTGEGFSIFIPAQAKVTMNQLSYLPAFSFNNRGISELYTFPAGSQYDITAGVIGIPLSSGKAGFSLYDTKGIEPVAFYYFGLDGPADNEKYEAGIENYISDAYIGWKGDRFDPDTGKWKLPDGSYSFNNEILASFAAEGLKRGRFSEVQKYLSLMEGQKDSISYISAPFAGRIVVTDEKRQEFDDLLKKRISNALKDSDYSVFLIDRLIDELNWISSSALFRTFNSFAGSIDLNRQFSPEVLVGMIGAYRDVVKGNSDQYHDVLRLYSVIESNLYPYLQRRKEGLFLLDSEERANIRLSIKAGISLYEIGQIEGDTLMSSIGRTLVASSLALKTAEGLLPLYLGGDESFYGADLFYNAMTENEYYPHLDSFNNVRIWSAAKDISFKRSSGKYTFNISFPRGIGHHLVIKGIPPFKVLKMHGIPWNSDRRFQYYTSGWVYNEKTRTLYMKLSQRKNQEQIIIEF